MARIEYVIKVEDIPAHARRASLLAKIEISPPNITYPSTTSNIMTTAANCSDGLHVPEVQYNRYYHIIINHYYQRGWQVVGVGMLPH